jgi:ferredoxin
MTRPDTGALPLSVVYRSRGSLLLCGEADQVRAALPLVPAGLKTLAVIRGAPSSEHPGPVQAVPGTLVQLRGHLGCFRAAAAGPLGPLDLAPLSPNGDGLFDLVLDLYEQPLIDSEVPPPGYLRTRGSRADLEARLERLARQVGTFNKPRYFSYDERLCAHDRQGVPGCRACLDLCPADAIHTEAGAIAIDPYLCRGCGTCTLACPTGAIRYSRPKPRATLQAIAEVLAPARGAPQDRAAARPPLVLHASDVEALAVPSGIPRLKVPTVGAVGIELGLAALALGASRVLLLSSGPLTPTTVRVIEQQIDLARRLLRRLGEAPERIRLVRQPQGLDWGGLSNPWPPVPPSRLAAAEGKRQLLVEAIGHLGAHLSNGQVNPGLEPGAPFGGIRIDAGRCTLCHACVGLCPTGALRNRAGALEFAEAHCVQCGLCVNGCPERALASEPLIDVQAFVSRAERTLKAASEVFPCMRCGAPVGPRSLVEGSMARVRSHPMFQGEGLSLLQMCMSCRQKASIGLVGNGGPDRPPRAKSVDLPTAN